jgi:hypothetical protein
MEEQINQRVSKDEFENYFDEINQKFKTDVRLYPNKKRLIQDLM